MTLKFKIEQVALCPSDPAAAIELLTAMGLGDWVHDNVVALGQVAVTPMERNDLRRDESNPVRNVAALAFNYQALESAKELEVLHYTSGINWMSGQDRRVSHLGMHCTHAELEDWKQFFSGRGIQIVQEVNTWSHSNPAIAGKRWYHYCIFDTYSILGVDIKFIVRRNGAEA